MKKKKIVAGNDERTSDRERYRGVLEQEEKFRVFARALNSTMTN